MLVGWAGSLGAGWLAVGVWIGVLAWGLLQLERSDAARGLPIGNVLREGYSGQDIAPGDLAGRVAVVTGASSGLGLEVARLLAAKGATVVLACRDLDKAAVAAKAPIEADVPGATVELVHLDLGDMATVRAAAAEIRQRWPMVDMLINNAGMTPRYPPEITKDGVELTFQANYLGHFELTRRLLPALRRARTQQWSPRVVFLTSSLHRAAPSGGVWLTLEEHNNFSNYDLAERYAVAKLACLAIAVAFDRGHGVEGIYFNAVHPGVVATSIMRDPVGVAMAVAGEAAGPWLAPLLAWGKRTRDALLAYTPRRAAATVVFAAASPFIEAAQVRGQYIVPEATVWPPNHLTLFDDDKINALWAFSVRLASSTGDGKTD